ncbi:DUF4097 family beta strand repeat-containing protein [Lysinibacillus sp. BPa_S21]|uniref:DUF4097 family beta strand repeat-containing protein n=1 Tax=Lysinibacillus sp. BPa_S21 TaxID=2932478 RepID=UPI002012AD7A|nr:DUF4097 family beta strand repeat-containing protein [Lysinibacillus sp. BPa_S21]MCL1696789.1 DUF4097 domain-containing protein [Lysinibacillus sp. BPa_S21]
MKKYCMVISVIFTIMFVSACSGGEEREDIQIASLKDIDSIYIENGSINIDVVSADIDELEANLLLYDNGPGIVMEKGQRKLTIRLKSDISRLFKIDRMPHLEVRVPTEFKGEIFVDSTSGNVVGKDLQMHDLQVSGSSGNVKLDFLDFHSDVHVTTTSGKVDISLNEAKPNATFLLKSNSGRRSVGIVLKDKQQSKKETKGTSGNGDYEVQLETSSGNITLK